jgi:hypothetical protein
MFLMLLRVNRLVPVLATATAATLLMSGCAAPSQTYAADKKDGVYFTVPYSWKKITSLALNARESQSTTPGASDRLAQVKWQEAYSPSAEIGPADVFNLSTPKSPIVYVRIRSLSADEANAVSYNALRNIIVPVTTWLTSSSPSTPKFQLLDDAESVQKIARGVHTIFEFTGSDGTSQTMNQTALVSDDRSTIYVLLLRSSTLYYNAHKSELEKIANSFTVRGNS